MHGRVISCIASLFAVIFAASPSPCADAPGPEDISRMAKYYPKLVTVTKEGLAGTYGNRIHWRVPVEAKDVLVCFKLSKYRKKTDLYNDRLFKDGTRDKKYPPGTDRDPHGLKKEPWEKPKRLPTDEELREKRMDDIMGSINTRDEYIHFVGADWRTLRKKGFNELRGSVGTVVTIVHNVDTFVGKADPTKPPEILMVQHPGFVLLNPGSSARTYDPGTRVILRLIPGKTGTGEFSHWKGTRLMKAVGAPVFEVAGTVDDPEGL